MTVDEWYEQERGIRPETLDAYKVRREWGAAVFPYPEGEKTRTGFNEGETRKFQFTPGKQPGLFLPPAEPNNGNVAFIVEGESDAMRLWQETGGYVYGLSGLSTWKPEFAATFTEFDTVFLILDNEDEYENPTAFKMVEKAASAIRRDVGPKVQRVRLPLGIKDVCEFFAQYDLDLLRELVATQPTVSRFKALDLSKAPPPPNWLLEGLIAKGDMTLVAGASGLGKSWLTLGLLTAVADGHETFLGLDIHAQGNVLYIDEENPEDVIYQRLTKLGLKNLGNVRYIWNNGIRLDKLQSAQELLSEAHDFKPELIVLDSLTRLHTKEENLAGDIAPLLNEGIKPLARETGAAVVVIHHHDKAGNGPRGSGDITASMDGALDAYAGHVPGQFRLKLAKSRRRMAGNEMTVKIADMPDGTVHLTAIETLDAPF